MQKIRVAAVFFQKYNIVNFSVSKIDLMLSQNVIMIMICDHQAYKLT